MKTNVLRSPMYEHLTLRLFRAAVVCVNLYTIDLLRYYF